jgi:hypothetical protein
LKTSTEITEVCRNSNSTTTTTRPIISG